MSLPDVVELVEVSAVTADPKDSELPKDDDVSEFVNDSVVTVVVVDGDDSVDDSVDPETVDSVDVEESSEELSAEASVVVIVGSSVVDVVSVNDVCVLASISEVVIDESIESGVIVLASSESMVACSEDNVPSMVTAVVEASESVGFVLKDVVASLVTVDVSSDVVSTEEPTSSDVELVEWLGDIVKSEVVGTASVENVDKVVVVVFFSSIPSVVPSVKISELLVSFVSVDSVVPLLSFEVRESVLVSIVVSVEVESEMVVDSAVEVVDSDITESVVIIVVLTGDEFRVLTDVSPSSEVISTEMEKDEVDGEDSEVPVEVDSAVVEDVLVESKFSHSTPNVVNRRKTTSYLVLLSTFRELQSAKRNLLSTSATAFSLQHPPLYSRVVTPFEYV